MPILLLLLVNIAALMATYCCLSEAADSKTSFEDNFSIMWSEDHFTTSQDGQIWHLSLDNETGIFKFQSTRSSLVI